jgi:hypothetical protein
VRFPALGPVLTPLAYLGALALLGLACYWVTRLALAPRHWCTGCGRSFGLRRTRAVTLPGGKVEALCGRCIGRC